MSAKALPKELESALELLEDVAQEGNEYRAICPIHGTHALSLKWSEASNALLVKCRAGCKQDELVAALRKLGIHIGSARHLYRYVDVNGVHRWTKVRSMDAKTKRRFTYWMCHSRKGVVPIDGVHRGKKNTKDDGTCRLCGGRDRPFGMFYNAEAVETARTNGDEIWIVEGEKDADALTAKGVIATTSMNGVDDWGPIYVDAITGAHSIVLVADNDVHDAGKRGAYNRYLSLTDHVGSIRVVMAKHGKDSYDHLHAGFGLNDFVPVPISELEALMEMAPDVSDATDPLPDEDWTNAGYAARFIALHGHEVIRVGDDWYVWDGAHWELDERRRVLDYSWRLSKRMTAVALVTVDKDGKTPNRGQSLKLQGSGNIAGTLTLASARLTFPQRMIDTDMRLLALRNGIYAGDGAFEPHDPLRLYTRFIDLAYDANAECPQWLRFLRSSIPDREQRKYLQTLLGFALVGGDRKKKRIVNLIGPKDTGKSTFLRVLTDILGPYMQTPAVEELVSHGRSSNDKFALSELRGSRIAAISETDAGSRFRIAPLKALTGGDMISTQSKHKHPITWRASVMLLIATNAQIMFDDTDQAFTDRCVYIEFGRKRRIDRTLGEKLEAERLGILKWLLDGADAYERDELIEPASVKRSRETAAERVSTPLQFIRYGLDSGALVSVADDFPNVRCSQVKPLYHRYLSWCEDEENSVRKPAKFTAFTEIVSQRYPKKMSRGVTHFVGIASKISVDEWKSTSGRKSS